MPLGPCSMFLYANAISSIAAPPIFLGQIPAVDQFCRRSYNAVNFCSDEKIPENVICKELIKESTLLSQVTNTHPLIILANDQNYDTAKLTLAINHLFSHEPPPEDMQCDLFNAAQQNIDSLVGYRDGKNCHDAVERQFLFLSSLEIYLQQNQGALPTVDRVQYGQRFIEFCDNKFLPHCSDKFGDIQTRFANTYVNCLKEVVNGQELDIEGLRNHLTILLDYNPTMREEPLPERRIENPAPTVTNMQAENASRLASSSQGESMER
jgi:hypothetical protein